MDSSSSSAGTSAFPSDENCSFNSGGVPSISSLTAAVSTRYQYYLDKATPFVFRRWVFFGVLVFIYVIRVVLLEGFHIVSYGLGIYMLNLFIAFLSPQVDPESQQLLESDVPTLPTRSSDEFRPFVRRLLEFKFWYSMTKAFIIAITVTFFSVFDVPVFWPILLFYWLVLFTVTMKRQILHMIKYRYLPFTFGKQRYDKRRTVPTQVAGAPKASV